MPAPQQSDGFIHLISGGIPVPPLPAAPWVFGDSRGTGKVQFEIQLPGR